MIVLSAVMAGCVGSAEPVPVNETKATVTATPTEIPTTIAPTPTPYVEPYSLFLYRTNGRYLGDPFMIQRFNVSGFKSMTVKVTVWGYRFLTGYQAHSQLAGDQYSTMDYWYHPAGPGWKWLFVYVSTEMVGDNIHQDPRIWAFGQNDFAVQIGDRGVQYPDQDREKCEVIREFENTWNSNNVTRLTDYGFTRIESLENPVGNPVTCDPQLWLRMGASNKMDGYIVYKVPIATEAKDLKVLGSFSFASAYWLLEKRPI